MQRFAQRPSSDKSKENKNGTSSSARTVVNPNVAADFGNVDMMAGDDATRDLMMDPSASFMDYDPSGADAWMTGDGFGTTDGTNFEDFGMGGAPEDPSILQASSEANFDEQFDASVDIEGQTKKTLTGIGVLSKTSQSEPRGDNTKTSNGGGTLFQNPKQSNINQKSTMVQQQDPGSLNKEKNRRDNLFSNTQNELAGGRNVVPQSLKPKILPKNTVRSEEMSPSRTPRDLNTSIDNASTTMGAYLGMHNVDHNLRVLPPPSPAKPGKKPSRVSFSPQAQPPPPPAQEQLHQRFGNGMQAEGTQGTDPQKSYRPILRQRETTPQPPLRRPVPLTLRHENSENERRRVTGETAKTPSPSGTKTTSNVRNIPAVTPGLHPSPKMADETAYSSIISTTTSVSPFPDRNNNKLSSATSHKSRIGNAPPNNTSTGDFPSAVDGNRRGGGDTGQQDINFLLDEGATFDDINVKFLSDIRDLEDNQKEIEVALLRRNDEFATAYFHALQGEANILDLLDRVEQETKDADEILVRYGYDG